MTYLDDVLSIPGIKGRLSDLRYIRAMILPCFYVIFATASDYASSSSNPSPQLILCPDDRCPSRYHYVSECSEHVTITKLFQIIQGIPIAATTGSLDIEKTREALLNELQCPICYETVKKPVTGNCGHTVCWDCHAMAMKSMGCNGRRCPICRRDEPIYALDFWLHEFAKIASKPARTLRPPPRKEFNYLDLIGYQWPHGR
jgi:hypothetical protein